MRGQSIHDEIVVFCRVRFIEPIVFSSLRSPLSQFVVQGLARCLYTLTSAVSDVRVCHPKVGEVVFIVTFVSESALDKFKTGPQLEFEKR